MDGDMSGVVIGQTVYDEEGTALGTVRGVTEDGFTVTPEEGIEALSVEHTRAGHELGEATLTWTCGKCGAIGDIENLPDSCPDCGAAAEFLYYRIED